MPRLTFGQLAFQVHIAFAKVLTVAETLRGRVSHRKETNIRFISHRRHVGFLRDFRPDYASRLNRLRLISGTAGDVGLIEWKLGVCGGAMTYRSVFLALTLTKL